MPHDAGTPREAPSSIMSSSFSLGFTPLSGSPASSVANGNVEKENVLFSKTTGTLQPGSESGLTSDDVLLKAKFDEIQYPWDIRYGSSVIESLSKNFEFDKSLSVPLLGLCSIGENVTTSESFLTLTNKKTEKLLEVIDCSNACPSNTSSVTA